MGPTLKVGQHDIGDNSHIFIINISSTQTVSNEMMEKSMRKRYKIYSLFNCLGQNHPVFFRVTMRS